jgi:beta propeller repeat protein
MFLEGQMIKISSITKNLVAVLAVLWILSFSASASVITPITTNGTLISHLHPSIDGSRIVWSDDRAGGVYATYLYDANTGLESRISPVNAFSSELPDISGNLIVYQDDSDPSLTPLYVYDIDSGITSPVTPDTGALGVPASPAISGRRIVWQDYRSGVSNIYINGTTPGSETALYPSGSDQEYPDIYGDLVVWQEKRNGLDYDIFLYNLTSNQEIQITSGNKDQMYPAIYDNRIVWMDNRNGVNNEVFINGTAPGSEYSLTPDGQAANHITPSIFGSKVIWQQGSSRISMNDTSLAVGSLSQIDTIPGSSPVEPKISHDPVYGDRIVWQETSVGNDIYLYTSGASGTCPVANFTHDFNGGAAPVTVHFSDLTIPAASLWFWDLGDGSNATGRTPGHTYVQNIPYDVSLTVGNPYCRNTSLKINSVVVGRPVADFSATPTSDIVPATISFTDLSSGSPTSWHWDFDDGSTETTQNPIHTYITAGTYSVSLTATNVYGSSVKTRTNYITILNGANDIANTTISGLTVTNCAGPQSLSVDTSMLTAALTPNNSVLEIEPPSDRGFGNITVYALDGSGFTRSGNFLTGTVTGVHLETRRISPTGFSSNLGSPLSVNYSVDTLSYPCKAQLTTKIWENAIAEDNASFQAIALGSHFSHYLGTAYTTKISLLNFLPSATAKLHMSVSSDLVSSVADGRHQTFIERISEDRTAGEVLDTQYVSHDSVNNLDHFTAGSPQVPSTYGLSLLSGSGNPLQLITLSVASHSSSYSGSSNNAGGTSDSSTAPGSGAGSGKGPAPANAPELHAPTVDPGKTEKIYSNANGVLSQATVLKSTDNLAMVSIDPGIVAKDSAGNPLSSITLTALSPEDVPGTSAGAAFMVNGLAYEITPDGATFSSPGLTISFTIPQAQWGQEYSIKTYDRATGTWQDLPSTFELSTGEITTHTGHLCSFAVFAKSLSETPRVTVPATKVPVTLRAPEAPPPNTAISIFTNLMVWVSDRVIKNSYAIIGVVALVCGLYIIKRWKFPGS